MNRQTVAFAVPATKKIIRDAYEARNRATDFLEQLRMTGEELTSTKVDAWTADVANRGVDLNSVVTTHDSVKRDLDAQQKKVEAVEALLSLVELRIKQLKSTNGADVVEVLKERIALLQQAKSDDERDVETANDAINSLWKEVRELDTTTSSHATGSKKK
jgi:chromosome segregation ATPase